MKRRWTIAIGLAAFLGALVLKAPVATLHGWIASTDAAAVRAYGLQGSVARGAAAGIAVDGRLLVSDLRWRFKPWWLALARAVFEVESHGAPAALQGELTLLPTGALKLSAARVGGQLKPLLAAAGYAFAPVDGSAAVDLAQLNLSDGFPTRAEGRLEVRGLAWTLARDPIALGDFEAIFSTEDGTIVADVGTLDGPLEVSGQARLQQDRSYELHLQIKAKPQANALVQNLLRSIGQPDAQGYFHLRRKSAP